MKTFCSSFMVKVSVLGMRTPPYGSNKNRCKFTFSLGLFCLFLGWLPGYNYIILNNNFMVDE